MLIVDAQVHSWGSSKPTSPAHRQADVFSNHGGDKELIMGRAVFDWNLLR